MKQLTLLIVVICLQSVTFLKANSQVSVPSIISLRYIHNYEGNKFIDASTDVPESVNSITKVTFQLINIKTNQVIIESSKNIHDDNNISVNFSISLSGVQIPNNIIAVRSFAEDALGNKSAFSSIEKRDLNHIFDIELSASKQVIKGGEYAKFITNITSNNANINHLDWTFEVNGKMVVFGGGDEFNTSCNLCEFVEGTFPNIEGVTQKTKLTIIITAENDEHIFITKKFTFTYQP
jgi:hypothetical protein